MTTEIISQTDEDAEEPIGGQAKAGQREGEDDILPSEFTVIEAGLINICFNPIGTPLNIKLAIDAGPGCGGTTWPAGRVLTDYLARRGPDAMHGKNILELGSGTGLVGIAAGKLGAGSVYITDQAPLVPIMEANVKLNEVGEQVKVLELNWGEPLPPSLLEIDIILAADCVYFEPAYPLLIQTLRDLHAANPTAEFLFCYRQRRKADKRFFLALLKKHFEWKEVDDDPNREIYSKKAVVLLRLKARVSHRTEARK